MWPFFRAAAGPQLKAFAPSSGYSARAQHISQHQLRLSEENTRRTSFER